MTAGRWAYLLHLLGWGLPVLGLQLGLLARAWGRRFPALLGTVLPPALWVTAWLVLGDELAISRGVWAFGEGSHLGVYLGHVPVEEALFFLLTNLMVAFGLALFSRGGAWRAAPLGDAV
jgi:lycopene cyclase domain-containing protein